MFRGIFYQSSLGIATFFKFDHLRIVNNVRIFSRVEKLMKLLAVLVDLMEAGHDCRLIVAASNLCL
jgi:hypothetical protein